MSTQVNTEYFTLDMSSVLTNIGGNLGLFLGYSVMTILLGLFESFKFVWWNHVAIRSKKEAKYYPGHSKNKFAKQ